MPEGLDDRLRVLLADDPVPEVRLEAARALGVTGGGQDERVEALITALDDPSDAVRRAATLALGRLPGPRSAGALVKTLADRPELWQEASAALATAGSTETLSELEPLLEAEASHVRAGALRAIAALSRERRPNEAGPLFSYRDDEGHRHPLF